MNIKRTNNGYQLHGIEATGLAPRESQALLLPANGLAFSEIAQHMSPSSASISMAQLEPLWWAAPWFCACL
ncbi:hypothetical protein [Cellvibrio polysaccharolyticus]|uniref:Uncharacterized protein n=1 Tax=Cellvibrio polysaccharolyticus TaxID=2082724 RepID=A0A928YUL4_9GAMM|nr:hypothetical protein [Cellvibrio polysaccharolyticus]MBE8717585.1 hypothetical protein [Cellvibrio polysaccharolyticus]